MIEEIFPITVKIPKISQSKRPKGPFPKRLKKSLTGLVKTHRTTSPGNVNASKHVYSPGKGWIQIRRLIMRRLIWIYSLPSSLLILNIIQFELKVFFENFADVIFHLLSWHFMI